MRKTSLFAVISILARLGMAQVVATGEVSLTGTIETVTSEGLTIRDPAGDRHQVRVQGKKERGVALADGTLLSSPADVTVRGVFPAASLKPGQVVRFRCRMDRFGKADAAIAELTVL